MKINFTETGWADYLYWQTQDKKTIKRISQLIQDIERNDQDGIGKPEPLRGNLSGWWSRHIDDTNRLIYRLNDDGVEISQCRGITAINEKLPGEPQPSGNRNKSRQSDIGLPTLLIPKRGLAPAPLQ